VANSMLLSVPFGTNSRGEQLNRLDGIVGLVRPALSFLVILSAIKLGSSRSEVKIFDRISCGG
jgi:hypothetical protein